MPTTSGTDVGRAAGGVPVDGRRRLAALGEAIAAIGPSARPDLPWRLTRDPWAVLVSEVMAQQTQVTRVVPSFERFMARFPTPAACAAATVGEVLTFWDGLGYNRRARNLHRTASVVVARHGGRLPTALPGLLDLPGVGPYTARAVLAFAFGADVGLVDTNAGRVLARAVAGRPLRAAEAQATVDAMVPAGKGWDFNQGLLDIGALCCTRRSPDCGRCPIARRCRWRRSGNAAADPAGGSAGASRRQPAFEGSDRQGRGRLVAALRRGPVPVSSLADAAGWSGDRDRAARVAEALVAEGLAVRTGRVLTLP